MKSIIQNNNLPQIAFKVRIRLLKLAEPELEENKKGTDKNFSYQSPVVHHTGAISNQIYEDLRELYKLKEILKSALPKAPSPPIRANTGNA